MAYNVAPLSVLVEQFESLPGIGHKTAQRLAMHMLEVPKEQAERFANAITEAREKIRYCDVCCNITDTQVCSVCANAQRDHSIICVVEDPRDVMALEKTREFNATYHVLHGCLSPMDGIGPEQLRIKELLARVQQGGVNEVIMATNPTVEGETTAMYISRLLKPLGIKVTRLAYGIPVGGDLEYADEFTLKHALEGRSEF